MANSLNKLCFTAVASVCCSHICPLYSPSQVIQVPSRRFLWSGTAETLAFLHPDRLALPGPAEISPVLFSSSCLTLFCESSSYDPSLPPSSLKTFFHTWKSASRSEPRFVLLYSVYIFDPDASTKELQDAPSSCRHHLRELRLPVPVTDLFADGRTSDLLSWTMVQFDLDRDHLCLVVKQWSLC